MNDFRLFLGKFLTHGTSIASIAPSSRWLAKTTVRNIDWTKARSVIELGAGTGPITQVIARNAVSACKVVVVERDADFAALLRERFRDRPNFDIVEADIRDLAAIVAERGIDRVDHIVSGLPVPSFPRPVRRTFFQTVSKVLSYQGSFNQITEFPWVYWPLYHGYFHDVQFAFEPRNLPPAGAYFCRGMRP